jgi:FkbM family methyltransferase
MKSIIKKILRKLGWKLIKLRKPPEPNPYGKLDDDVLKSINNSTGIVHLGAHRGLEAEVYNWFGKNVIWVEAIPKIYKQLSENLYFYKNQLAFQALLTDEDDKNINFYISNYDSACSSIYKFTENIKSSKIWSDRNHQMIDTLNLKSKKLDTLFTKEKIDPKNYNHWILDLQGAELLALKGAEKSLESCKSIYIEVSIKKFYNDGVLWDELKEWLISKNFYPTRNPVDDEEDILFIKKTNSIK